MTRSNKWMLFIILIIFVLAVLVVFPLDKGYIYSRSLRQDVDLKGGVLLVYQGVFSDNVSAADQSAAMDREVLTIQKRIDSFGVTEPIIQKLGSNRLQIQLPGFTDIDAAKALVEQTGYLEFRGVEKNSAGSLVYLKDYLSDNVTDFYDTTQTSDRLFVNENGTGSDYGQLVAVVSKDAAGLHITDASGNPADNVTLAKYTNMAAWIPLRGSDGTPLTGTYLSDAQANINSSTSQPEIDITWNSTGAKIFDEIAAVMHNPAGQGGTYSLQYAMGIFLDKNLLSAPQLTSTQYEGKGTISGSFTLDKAQQLANLLKSGALPVQLDKTPLRQQMVSATLGSDSLSRSLRAGLIGIILVALFMIAYYRYLGAVAVAALLVYGALSLAIFKIIGVTLTLPGIAGFIISVGMALDANILIFERLKEEIRLGRTLDAGMTEGFRRAWPSIRDSNISTFITCLILFWFGSYFGAFMVKGFAITLFLGVAVSMFSAIMVTRTFLVALARSQTAKKLLLGSAK